MAQLGLLERSAIAPPGAQRTYYATDLHRCGLPLWPMSGFSEASSSSSSWPLSSMPFRFETIACRHACRDHRPLRDCRGASVSFLSLAEILAGKSARFVILPPSAAVACAPGTLASVTGGTGEKWIVIRRPKFERRLTRRREPYFLRFGMIVRGFSQLTSRESNNCRGDNPCRRATEQTELTLAAISATIRALSSSLHRRRRPNPVNSQQQRRQPRFLAA
jgi:hypothetical protein